MDQEEDTFQDDDSESLLPGDMVWAENQIIDLYRKYLGRTPRKSEYQDALLSMGAFKDRTNPLSFTRSAEYRDKKQANPQNYTNPDGSYSDPSSRTNQSVVTGNRTNVVTGSNNNTGSNLANDSMLEATTDESNRSNSNQIDTNTLGNLTMGAPAGAQGSNQTRQGAGSNDNTGSNLANDSMLEATTDESNRSNQDASMRPTQDETEAYARQIIAQYLKYFNRTPSPKEYQQSLLSHGSAQRHGRDETFLNSEEYKQKKGANPGNYTSPDGSYSSPSQSNETGVGPNQPVDTGQGVGPLPGPETGPDPGASQTATGNTTTVSVGGDNLTKEERENRRMMLERARKELALPEVPEAVAPYPWEDYVPTQSYEPDMFDRPEYQAAEEFSRPEYEQAQDFIAPTASDMELDPGYQFMLSEGQKALERSGAARGVTNTGGNLKDITDYGRNAASQEYKNVYGRRMGEYTRSEENRKAAYDANYSNAMKAWEQNEQNRAAAFGTNYDNAYKSSLANAIGGRQAAEDREGRRLGAYSMNQAGNRGEYLDAQQQADQRYARRTAKQGKAFEQAYKASR